MGTSAGYAAPPAWSSQKSELTKKANIPLSPAAAKAYVGKHIKNNGGVSRIISGGGVLGGGGRSVQKIAGEFAGFVGQVAREGLNEALRQNNLADLIGRPPADIILGLFGIFDNGNNSIDGVDARNAGSRLMDELLADTDTAEDVEKVLAGFANAEALAEIAMKFFAYHLYEQFCRIHYEHLVQRHGTGIAESFLGQIRDCIESLVWNHTLGFDVTCVDWTTEWGEFADGILRETLEVFE